MKRYEASLDLYNVVLGAFLFVSPWLFAYGQGSARDSAFVSGAILVVMSLLAIVAFREWEEWTNLAIGGWILASPWVLQFPHKSAMRVAVTVGGIVVFLSLLELWLLHHPGWQDRSDTPRRDGGGES